MTVAENLRIVSDYEYRTTPSLDTAVSYVVTVNKESNRKPEKYSFWVGEHGIIDPKTFSYVKDLVDINTHKRKYLGLVENSIIYQTDAWSVRQKSKVALWVSPELLKEGNYSDNKLVVSMIDYSPSGQKVVKNLMVIFECDRDTCLSLAKEIAPEQTKNINSPEELRCSLLTLDEGLDLFKVIEILRPYIPKNKDYKPPSPEVIRYIGQLIVDRAPGYFIAQEMSRLDVLGEHKIACLPGGQTYTEILTQNSVTIDLTPESGGISTCCGAKIVCGCCSKCNRVIIKM